MSDNDKSLGDQHTFDGEISDEADANSLGDEKTYAGGANAGPSSLGDEMTFGGDAAGLDDDLYDDQMEIVDLESRYTTEGVLGKGGMGEVLLATDTRLERKVAIKRILGKAARSRTAVNRFLTEAKSVAAINHPNIVQIYDYGRAKDGPFLIMECVEGNSLLDRCRQGAIPLEESIDLVVQLCDGLAAAHDAHIIHRDIKPANILLTKSNIPKLTDFGLAKAEAADTGMTMAGAVLGTLDFMPPEQRKDAALVDQRSDLWSLAATFYQMVTGKSPKIIKFNDVPKELHDVLGKALEDEKDDRYQSARDFKEALLASRSGTAEVELAEGDCPHCGTKNPTNRKFCRNPDCSESLEVPCLSCQSGIPMWEQVCDSCGTPQHELLEQRRTQMASEQAETESLLKGLDFDRAKSMAVTLRDEPDLRLMHLKGWAERFLGEIEKGREQELARLAELMKEAVTHQQAHDYAAGLRTLEQVPKIVCNTPLPGHDQTVNDLRKKLQSTLDEIKRLDPLIRTRVKNCDLDGLLAEVEQLQRLQPGRDNLQKLADQLNKRDSKLATTRDEALAEAKKRLANQDYDGCLEQLNRIDASLVDADVESLKQAAETNRGQVNTLRDGINLAVQGKQLDGLLPQVEQCLALQADAEDMQKLRDQLVERESRNAALVAGAMQQAEQFRKACQFDQAVAALERISDGLATQPSDELLFECQSLHDNQTRAMQAMNRASETGEFNKALAANETYQRGLSASGLHDPVFESASAACQQQLAARQESEQAARRQKALMIKLGIGAAALVVVVVSVMVVLSVQKGMRASAIATAIEQGDYATALEMDPDNAEALAMKKEADIKQALAKGDYQAALQIDPNHAEALAMKKEADIKPALAKGDYQAALQIDPNHAEALAMKKEADIKQALAKGDYQAAFELDPDNSEAFAMVERAKIKKALAGGDFLAALAMDPENAEALAMKKEADIKEALDKRDYQRVLKLDSGNTKARRMVEIQQAAIEYAVAQGDWATVLDLDPDNSEALANAAAGSTGSKGSSVWSKLGSSVGSSVGDKIQNIEGKDLDGEEFSLDDYQGKVMMINFWGDWCPTCRAMYDHERSLVNKYSGRPFVLLGINNDEDADIAIEAIKQNNLNWRSGYDGSGFIAKAFSITGYPTILLVDHHGVIRYRSPFEVDLDDAIAELVKEAEGDGVTGGAEPMPKLREFVDLTGEHKTVASYAGYADGNVALETEAGKTVQVPWSRLGLEDQQYVANLRLKAAGLGRIAKEEIAFSFDQPQQFWDESGQHSITGTYITLDNRQAIIWQEDGSEVRVSYSKLSDEAKELIYEELNKRK